MTADNALESPAKQVATFIARFDPAITRLASAARSGLRRRFPTAVELVYDNYDRLSIGWGPNERASEAVVSLVLFPRRINLYFTNGAKLSDPGKLLQGGGKGRYIRLENAVQLDEPDVVELLNAATQLGKSPLPANGKGYTVIKSVSANQRPRRPNATR